MKRTTVMIFQFKTKCFICDKEIGINYTVPDFGDPPVLLRCKLCGEYYWYTPDDAAWQPIDQQLISLKCVKCQSELNKSLVPTHKSIECCGEEFSLDDDFAGHKIPDDNARIPLDVNLIYS